MKKIIVKKYRRARAACRVVFRAYVEGYHIADDTGFPLYFEI